MRAAALRSVLEVFYIPPLLFPPPSKSPLYANMPRDKSEQRRIQHIKFTNYSPAVSPSQETTNTQDSPLVPSAGLSPSSSQQSTRSGEHSPPLLITAESQQTRNSSDARSSSMSKFNNPPSRDDRPLTEAAVKEIFLEFQEAFRKDMQEIMNKFSKDMKDRGGRTPRPEEKTAPYAAVRNSVANNRIGANHKISAIHPKPVYVEDGARQNYIRFCGIDESMSNAQLRKFITDLFSFLIPEADRRDLAIDRVHRLPKPKHLPDSSPRDVLARVHCLKIKERILRAASKRPSLPDRFKNISLSSDLSAKAVDGRGECRDATRIFGGNTIKYRFIQLDNGLRALLISDMASMVQSATESSDEEEEDDDDDEEEWDSEDESEEESEEEDEHEDSDSQCTKDKKACAEKLSAAALCIGVGSFSDPDDLPGLAHFLEHMVFMGSEKYPDENGFDAFLKKHGGSDNASTDCERTIFQFDVQRKHFKEALDRWAQFFISPLMVSDAIDREVQAVDSEYELARPLDSNRKEMLFGSLAKPGHPMGKFFWGNAQTLKYEPEAKNIDTHVRLREFYRTYYSAHYMTLAVQSNENLDTLEEWVREIFSKIPNNGLRKPDFSHLSDPFDTPGFNSLYRVVPVKKVHALTITWALPPQERYYKVKPLHYISWLIGHEGKGSILSLLRKKCWALALFGGNSETGFEQNTTYSVFSISITLTDAGYEHFYEVCHLVFQYLRMLQQLGPQERIFQEIQKIEANEFQYQEQTDPIEYVENICENMQLFPKEDFLTGDQLLFDYNPDMISDALRDLTPEKANLLLLSPDNEGKCNLKEKWFGTQYSTEEIDAKWKELWATDFLINPDLHLPAENKFIATDFTMKSSDCPDTEYPKKILALEQGCLWYKKDNKFKIPKAYIRFHLISPLIQQSPETLVLFDIFVNILAHTLAEPAYEADVAQLEYKLVAGEHGLVIKVKGFNHKLPLLFELIIDHLADFMATSDVYEMITEQLKKTYYNILIKPEKLGKDVRLLILEHDRWSMIEKYHTILKGLTLEQLLSFVEQFKSRLYVEGLVQGNFTSKESAEFLNYVTSKLRFLPLKNKFPVQFQVVELPPSHHLCKIKSLNKGDSNSEVTVYYQSGARNLRDYTLMELLVMHMEEPCFDFLRTKQTLGYHVYPTCRNTSGILGFSVTVETQANKFNSEAVDKKIEEFLVCFGEKIENLSDDAFKTQVKALIKLKECEDTHLGEEVDRNWGEVLTQQYLFDRLEKEIDVLRTFNKVDMVRWFQVHRGCDRKVLSVHVVGFGEKEPDVVAAQTPSREPESSYGNITNLIFLPVSPLMADTVQIRDIRSFTSTLKLLPYHKIVN